ncbi:hypothetical protein ALI144C_07200 [Actinosynnema sp. ALI-1.44]|uniref:DUF2690 domain-containing protein n=1 Tax=Actinosynnema sp. ALI-1.44 TaxID=1933779 RepID=UPI00097CA36C|nr:hypothetical protein ALI144C_07200 [Actinosynnema sp. ALI-1.44]
MAFKYVRVSLATLAVFFGGLVAPAAATASQPQGSAEITAACHGSSCNHKDPAATGCAGDGRTVSEFIYRGYRVEHRYSPACAAMWTRKTYVSGSAWSFYGAHEAITGNGIERNRYSYSGGWTSMWSYFLINRSCGVSNTGTHCGEWVG